MDLEGFKSDWKSLNEQYDKSQLSDLEIQNIIDRQNQKSWIKSFIPETIFMVIYFYLAFFLVMFNQQFENSANRVLLFFSVFILLCQCGMIYSTINLFNKKLLLTESYKSSIDNMKIECKKLNRKYFIILCLSVIILLSCVILIPKVYQENLSSEQLWVSYFIGIIILGIVKFKIYKYYKGLIDKTNSFKKRLSLS